VTTPLPILHRADDWLAVDKPHGMFVHPPEDGRTAVPPSETALHILRDQIGQKVYPVHRLDRPTSGILIFALTPARAAWFQAQLQSHTIAKYYTAVTRGWINGAIDCTEPLKTHRQEADQDRQEDQNQGQQPLLQLEARTTITPIARTEVNKPLGRFPSTRLTLLVAEPHTGRYHQIRRHLAHMGHPIAGDTTHGDLRFNRYLTEHLGWEGLMLRAASMQVPADATSPAMQTPSVIAAPWPKEWLPVLTHFNLSPDR